MKWWQIRKRNAYLVRELQSDLELEEEEQRADTACRLKRLAMRPAALLGILC